RRFDLVPDRYRLPVNGCASPGKLTAADANWGTDLAFFACDSPYKCLRRLSFVHFPVESDVTELSEKGQVARELSDSWQEDRDNRQAFIDALLDEGCKFNALPLTYALHDDKYHSGLYLWDSPLDLIHPPPSRCYAFVVDPWIKATASEGL